MRGMLAALLLAVLPVHAAISVVDDAGRTVILQRPAQRIISLSPHATELLFAAGGGERVVAAVDYSDYPPAARRLPRVGDNRSLDLERIAALKPDLLVAWTHGNAERQLQRLRELGVPVFHSEPRTLEQVAASLERLGRLTGSDTVARPAAAKLRQRVERLRARYAKRPPVRIFYQVWDQPLMTLNGRHLVGELIRLCGGDNPFAALPELAPTVGLEAVLASDPEAIITSTVRGETPRQLLAWKAYPTVAAVRRGNLFTVDADLMDRLGPRIVDGAEQLCRVLDEARARRPR